MSLSIFHRVCFSLLAVFFLSGEAFAGKTHCCGEMKNLQIYLLIGQSNRAGRAEIPKEASRILERCYLLNDKNEWEPARVPLNRHSGIGKGVDLEKLGPGYSFANKILEQNKEISIGLIVNAGGGSNMAPWTANKPKSYWNTRKRTKSALAHGTAENQ